MRLLIVDDSITFRSVIKAALSQEPGFEIVGTAANGKIALTKMKNDPVDVVILDLEMPEMDGIETLKAMELEKIKARVLVFASPTSRAYEKVRQALKLGAHDVIAKPIGENHEGSVDAAVDRVRDELLPRLRLIDSGAKLKAKIAQEAPVPAAVPSWQKRDILKMSPDALVIASSTGGPMALERFFEQIKRPLRVPVFIVQHMPPPFTKNLAERIAEITGFPAKEAEHNEVAVAGHIYVAPAEFHLKLNWINKKVQMEVYKSSRINYVIPSADPLFQSAADIFGPKLFAVVLTGMGEDGKRGSCAVKEKGGAVMIQDQASCVVWGMPGSVYEAGAYDKIAGIEECGQIVSNICCL